MRSTLAVRGRAPLRLGLAGGGTDVSPYCDLHGGAVLNATIDRYAHCTVTPRNDGMVAFEAPDMGVQEVLPATTRLETTGPCKLQKAVYNRIVADFRGGEPLPLTIATTLDAPPGSGLGSSSTMVVCLVGAFTELLALPLGEYDIAHLAYVIERVDMGLTGGKQDQYAAAFGGVNLIEFYANDRVIVNPLRVKDWILQELEESLVTFYTGVSRESAHIIDEQIRNTTNKAAAPVEAMHQLKADAARMKEALLFGDVRRFAEVLDSSWQAKKRMASAISNKHIDAIDAAARGAGAVAGKVTGAGGGGYMMFVVPPRYRRRLVDTLDKIEGGRVMDFHFVKEGATAWRTSNGSLE